MQHRIPIPSVVVLIGASGSGKSRWAAETFDGRSVVSSDAFRGLLGEDEADQQASDAAFAMLEDAVATRLARSLTTVIDTVGNDPARRRRWIEAARAAEVPVHAVVFEVPASVCKARNRSRTRRVPESVIDAQARSIRDQRTAIDAEGFDTVLVVDDRTIPAATVTAGPGTPGGTDADAVLPGTVDRADRADRADGTLGFGLHLSRFAFDGGPTELGTRLREIAATAEEIGFSSLRVMDHPIQIPQVGRAWDDILEPMVTLAHLAAATERITIGPLVAGITYRNVGMLGQALASLDVLSGGRVEAGLGLAWYARDHAAHGIRFPSVDDRYALLSDAVPYLRALWGPGTKPYEGPVISVPETTCYPRPLRGTIPILIGGSGERRTLAVVAAMADAANLFGPPEVVARRVEALADHCRRVDRDPGEVRVTHLATALVGADDAEVAALVAEHGPRRGVDRWRVRVNAGTVDDHVRRCTALAAAGVDEAIVAVEGLARASDLDRLAPLVAAFR